jgi:hypothetical protein
MERGGDIVDVRRHIELFCAAFRTLWYSLIGPSLSLGRVRHACGGRCIPQPRFQLPGSAILLVNNIRSNNGRCVLDVVLNDTPAESMRRSLIA